MAPDVLILDRIGGDYNPDSLQQGGLGGSEIEVLQVAKGLTERGYSVAVANGVQKPIIKDGIQFVPAKEAITPTKAFYIQRSSIPEKPLVIPENVRVVVRANDVYCPAYDVHRGILESGRAALVANTRWQSDLFQFAKERIVIPPILEPMPKAKREKGLFVFASGAMKGFDETLAKWIYLKGKFPDKLRSATLAILWPGWGHKSFSNYEHSDVFCCGDVTPEEYRTWIAKAEGVFMVSTMAETFCCAAALADKAGTRTHILCRNGLGGIPEAISKENRSFLTEDENQFEQDFIRSYGSPTAVICSPPPAGDIDQWEKTLHLKGWSVEWSAPDDPSLKPNQESLGPFFGEFLSLLRGAIAPGGSEFGVGLTLFSLAASIRAKEIVEIGRFKGFSTLALAAAAQLQNIGWQECKAGEQRPDVDYGKLLAKKPASVLSIDPSPHPGADALLAKANLSSMVRKIDKRSGDVQLTEPVDFLFIDGSHRFVDVREDVQRFVPWVRAGGYFVLHDFYGWFDAKGQNGSPVSKVIAEDLNGFERLLIDTGFASMVIFRKTKDLDPKLPKAKARADGRPTVGLVMIAKGVEASTVVTRAIMSAKKIDVDCMTVVCDATEQSADIVRSLGADVVLRKSPEIDWEKGIGIITGARNEALAIAEHRTDYLLVLDADDWLEGELPKTLEHDAYEIIIQDGGLQYTRIILFRSCHSFRYSGIIHEVIETSGSVRLFPGLRYIRGYSHYSFQDQDPPSIKYSKHARWIGKWLIDHPEDTRAQFYLARSFHDAGRFDEAKSAYEKRIAMNGGWDEERWYSAYQIGLIEIQQGLNPTDSLLRAHELCSTRAEPLVALAQWHRDDKRKHFSTAYAFAKRAAEMEKPASGLFMNVAAYEYEALTEWAIAAYWIGKRTEALEVFERILVRVPPDKKKWATEMIALCKK